MSRNLLSTRSVSMVALALALVPGPLLAQARSRPGPSAPRAAASPSPAPEPTPPPGWQAARSPSGPIVRLTRDSQEGDKTAVWREGQVVPRASLAIECDGKTLRIALRPAAPPAFLGVATSQEPVLLRLDQDKAFQESTSPYDFGFPDGASLVERFLAHDWLVLRYAAHDGYREHTFDLSGLEAALLPLESSCGLPAGTVAAAAAGRPPQKRPTPPSAEAQTSTVGAWSVLSRPNRFDDSRTVLVSTEASGTAASVGRAAERPRLAVRALGGKVEVFITFPRSVSRLESVRFDGAPAGPYRGDSATGLGGLFLSPTPRLLRDIAGHRRMVVAVAGGRSGDTVADFDLAGFDKVVPRVLEAAGLTPAALVETPRTGKWQVADADLSQARLRVAGEGSTANGAALVIACRDGQEAVSIAAPGVTDRSTKNMLVAFDGEVPQRTTLYTDTGSPSGVAVLPLARVRIDRKELLRHRRLAVRFTKADADIVFDLAGLETWQEPLDEAGCSIK